MADETAVVTLIRGAELREVPWQNGAGTTREIAAHAFPDDPGPVWRMSLATIECAAPFSIFTGMDRLLAVVAGTVAMTGSGAPFPALAQAGDTALTFPGENAVASEPVGGSALVLNLMTRRGVDATLGWQAPGRIDLVAPVVLIFAATPMTLLHGHDHYQLGAFDTVRLGAGGPAVHVDRPCLIATIASPLQV